MKKMKNFVVCSVLLTVVYAILLIVLGSKVETSIGFGNFTLTTLPFKVSAWWNLLLLPISIIVIVYCFSSELIVGKEPKFPGWPGTVEFKYSARLNVYATIARAASVSLGIIVIYAFVFLFWSGWVGPLSSLIVSVIIWIIFYCLFGFGSEFFRVLDWEVCKEEGDLHNEITESLTLKYKIFLAIYVKMGIIKTLPFLLGLTCGFIVKQLINKTFSFFDMRNHDFAG